MFRSAAQSAGGKSVGDHFKGRDVLFYLSRYFRYQVDDVRKELHFAVICDLDQTAVATEVVTGEVNEHNVFAVFLTVFGQLFGQKGILFIVASSFEGAGNGVNLRYSIFDH